MAGNDDSRLSVVSEGDIRVQKTCVPAYSRVALGSFLCVPSL